MSLVVISHHECELHDMGAVHPESPQRLAAIHDFCLSSGLDIVLRHLDAPLVSDEQLLRVHGQAYLTSLHALASEQDDVPLDDDTILTPRTLQAARRAAGAVVLATDLVCAKDFERAFCSVRPPGHHAEHERAMGFCFFNNVAVGVAHALNVHGLQRVAVADFDVHHGNGTEDIFKDDPRVLICSSFEDALFPFTGGQIHRDHIVDVPLRPGAKGDEFRTAIAEHWLAALHAFRPELLFVSAGFDGHWQDDMSHLLLTEADYKWVTEQLVSVAEAHCGGHMVSVLEGGYEPHALARSVVAHLRVLAGV